jgi:hypothetical protein
MDAVKSAVKTDATPFQMLTPRPAMGERNSRAVELMDRTEATDITSATIAFRSGSWYVTEIDLTASSDARGITGATSMGTLSLASPA